MTTVATTPDTADVTGRDVKTRRLLKSSAERNYDPVVDIDWDGPLDDEKWFHPEQLVSLYGTPLWESMTPEQRRDLARYETTWTMTRGIFSEVGLMGTLLKVAAKSGPTSPHTHYALTEIAEECRHSIMFGRTAEKCLGDDVDKLPKIPAAVLQVAQVLQSLLPLNAATWAGILMVEDILDKMQRETTRDETVQPLIRMMNRIHILEEARHMSYAREELMHSVATSGRVSNAISRFVIALGAWADPRLAIHPQVYRNVGLDPREARRQALASPHRRAVIRRHAQRYVETMEQAGMLRGRVTMALWRRSLMLEPGR